MVQQCSRYYTTITDQWVWGASEKLKDRHPEQLKNK